jgi:hypothetical protein
VAEAKVADRAGVARVKAGAKVAKARATRKVRAPDRDQALDRVARRKVSGTRPRATH